MITMPYLTPSGRVVVWQFSFVIPLFSEEMIYE